MQMILENKKFMIAYSFALAVAPMFVGVALLFGK